MQVSWIQSGSDLRLLSVGRVRYIADDRFTPLHEDGNEAWVLKVQDVRPSDSGQYECQVNIVTLAILQTQVFHRSHAEAPFSGVLQR